jgi:hypothetical protein
MQFKYDKTKLRGQRIALMFATVLTVVDGIYLLCLHLVEILSANEDGVTSHWWWDISRPMREFWFEIHLPWSRFLQSFFYEIWTDDHKQNFLQLYLYEAICIIQTVVVGYILGIVGYIFWFLFFKKSHTQ